MLTPAQGLSEDRNRSINLGGVLLCQVRHCQFLAPGQARPGQAKDSHMVIKLLKAINCKAELAFYSEKNPLPVPASPPIAQAPLSGRPSSGPS